MSKLQDLIDSLCPNGVEFKPLVSVANVLYGFPFDSKYFCEDDNHIPLIRIRDVKPAKASTYYSGDFPKQYIVRKGDILVGMDGNFNLEKWNDCDGLLNQRVCKIFSNDESLVLNGYLYHLLGPIFKAIEDELHSGTVIHLSSKRINKILIPIPPLPVQEEIVRILDRFSNYAAELQAELQARKEQYEYYRNLLLTFNPSACGCGTDDKQKDSVIAPPSTTYKIQWKKMGEIGKLITTRINADEVNTYVGVENLLKDRAGCIPSNELPIGDSHIGFNINDILIGNIRPYLKKIWLADRNGGTNGDVLTIRLIDTELSPKFLYHVLASDAFFFYHNQYAKGAKMPRGDKDMVMKYLIPIPPIELQEKIAAILDRFETLVNDISKGLPAEIEAQKTRYEYYRNKLLTFKPLPA